MDIIDIAIIFFIVGFVNFFDVYVYSLIKTLFLNNCKLSSTPIPTNKSLNTLKKLEEKLESERKRLSDFDDHNLKGTYSPNGQKYMKMDDYMLQTNSSCIQKNIKECSQEIRKFFLEEIKNMAFKDVSSYVKKFGYDLELKQGGIRVIKISE